MEYTTIQIIYGISLLILTCVVGLLYWTHGQGAKLEGFKSSQKQGDIYIFYHIYCTTTTRPIVIDQLTKIMFSELYPKLKTIYCFLTGDEKEIKSVRKVISKFGKKFKVADEGPGDTSYERFTLLKIRDYIKPEDKFVYIHSKGVSREPDGEFIEAIYWWRTYMEYNLLVRASECLKLLDTYDILGVAFSTFFIGPHFSGNFWWSTGKYYLSLEPKIGPEYNDPESYIFTGKPKYKILDEEQFDMVAKGNDLYLYKNIVFPREYINKPN